MFRIADTGTHGDQMTDAENELVFLDLSVCLSDESLSRAHNLHLLPSHSS